MGKAPKLHSFIFWLLIIGYITTGIIILPLQLAIFILIKPWSLWLYRKISYYFSLIMYWNPIFLIFWWSNSNIQIFANPDILHKHVGKEHIIFLMNHRYETEMFIFMAMINYFGCVGNIRGVGKKSVGYLPITGWLWKLQEHIFIERDFQKDKSIIRKAVQSLMTHTDAVSILVFPEGTRFTEEKHKCSMVVAKEKGLPTLKHHLLPRVRGFAAFVEAVKSGGKSGLPVVVYDGVFVIESSMKESKSSSVLDLLCGRGQTAKLLLRRYPIEDIPDNETECANWLHKVYQEKDVFMDNCLKTGTFAGQFDGPADSLHDYKFISLPKPRDVLMFIGGWNVVCLLYLLKELMYLIESGDVLQIITFVSLVILAYFVFVILSYSVKPQTKSSYGISPVSIRRAKS